MSRQNSLFCNEAIIAARSG